MSADSKGLLPEERRRLILAHLADRGSVRVAELAEQLSVTPVTIRRDLDILRRRGDVKRVHGGVTLRTENDLDDAGLPSEGNPAETGQSASSGGDQPVIGMVVPSLDYYWPSVARGARSRAQQCDLKLVLRESAYNSPSQDRKQIEHLVERAGARGLVLTVDTSQPKTLELLQRVEDTGVAVVLIERQAELPSEGTPMESVRSDHRSGAVLAVKLLTDLGHRKIGIVCPSESPTTPHLQEGWEQACQERGVSPESTLNAVIDNEAVPEVREQRINEVLDRCQEMGITAVMVHADPEANLLVQAAQLRGINVPDDLSVVAYDDEVASLFTPALTAVRPPRYTIGETAIDLMAARLRDPDRPVHRVILSPRLTVRESTTAPARG